MQHKDSVMTRCFLFPPTVPTSETNTRILWSSAEEERHICEKLEKYYSSPENLQLNQQTGSCTAETHDPTGKICVPLHSPATKH